MAFTPKKIYSSNTPGQAPSSGTELAQHFNDNFDAVKLDLDEKDKKIVQLEQNTAKKNFFDIVGFISKTNGNHVVDDAYICTNYIILPHNTFAVNGVNGNSVAGIAYYDQYYNYIDCENIHNGDFSVTISNYPSGAKYFRVSARTLQIDRNIDNLSTNSIISIVRDIDDSSYSLFSPNAIFSYTDKTLAKKLLFGHSSVKNMSIVDMFKSLDIYVLNRSYITKEDKISIALVRRGFGSSNLYGIRLKKYNPNTESWDIILDYSENNVVEQYSNYIDFKNDNIRMIATVDWSVIPNGFSSFLWGDNVNCEPEILINNTVLHVGNKPDLSKPSDIYLSPSSVTEMTNSLTLGTDGFIHVNTPLLYVFFGTFKYKSIQAYTGVLKRRDFLYVDLPKKWDSQNEIMLKIGNIEKTYTDERGIINKADYEISDGESIFRYVIVAVSSNGVTLSRNNLPVGLPKSPAMQTGSLFTNIGYIHKTSLSAVDDSNFVRTDYLPYDSSIRIDISGTQGSTACALCVFYDKSKNPISSLQLQATGDLTHFIDSSNAPSDCKYFIISSSAINAKRYVIYTGGISIASIISMINNIDNDNKAIINTESHIAYNNTLNLRADLFSKSVSDRENYLRYTYLNNPSTPKWYGVEYSEIDNPDNVIAINSSGDDDLHISLPIQNKIRRCITKDGIIKYYLNRENSDLKEDGTESCLDGTDGDVMVEIPEFFYKTETDIIDNTRVVRIKISEQPLPDFSFSPRRYTSAYEATLDRSINKLASVCTTRFKRENVDVKIKSPSNYTADDTFSLGVNSTATISGYSKNAHNYRGGVNNSVYDNAIDELSKDYSLNQLGRPISNITRDNARDFQKKDSFMYLYDTQCVIWMLLQVEFKTRNIQKSIANGGLGLGATVYPSYEAYEAFFKPVRGISCLPAGITNCLGNLSGEVYFKMINVPIACTGSFEDAIMTEWGDVWMPVMSYRGIENYYGHIYKIADQINVKIKDTGTYVEGHDGDKKWEISNVDWYYQPNPYLSSNNTDDYLHMGRYTFPVHIMTCSSLLIGNKAHVLHINTSGKNYDLNYCDCTEFTEGEKYITFNGRIVSNKLVGNNFLVAENNINAIKARPSDGTRLDHF